MALIAQTDGATSGNVPANITRTTMTASDTLTYVQGTRQMLFLYNTTASPVTTTLTGSTAGSLNVPSYGPLSVSGGKAVTVPASGSTLVDLDDIGAYLQGTVTITNGTGLTAHLYV